MPQPGRTLIHAEDAIRKTNLTLLNVIEVMVLKS